MAAASEILKRQRGRRTMSESFELDDELDEFTNRHAEPDSRGEGRAPVASGSVAVFTEGDSDRLAYRSSLGSSLSQITARLLQQLTTGEERTPNRAVGTADSTRRDSRGNRVPRDDSPLVSWKRVVAVSAAGSLLALVSLPVPSGSDRTQAQGASA
jgi:hypothetical protein